MNDYVSNNKLNLAITKFLFVCAGIDARIDFPRWKSARSKKSKIMAKSIMKLSILSIIILGIRQASRSLRFRLDSPSPRFHHFCHSAGRKYLFLLSDEMNTFPRRDEGGTPCYCCLYRKKRFVKRNVEEAEKKLFR